MNPIDHPHGGRTKSNSPEVTPWGKITKRSH
jgi:ribosomal protein L2